MQRPQSSGPSYIQAMKAEADERRKQAAACTDAGEQRWLLERAQFFDQCADEEAKRGDAKEVEFLPLLKASQGQMISRRLLHEYGVTDAMIEAAEQRGEVVTSGPGFLASVILTSAGAALYP